MESFIINALAIVWVFALAIFFHLEYLISKKDETFDEFFMNKESLIDSKNSFTLDKK